MVIKKSTLIEKIMNIILNTLIIIFSVLLIITIYNNIQTKILKNSYSSFFGYSMFEVQTGSMADTINIGDLILVKYTKSINLNDIVTYKHKGEFITHRVIEVYKETYVTKGDFNNAKDDPITQEQIVGKVIKIFPNFGIFRKTLLNPVILLALIITMALAMQAFKKNNKFEEQTDDYETKEVKGVVMGKLIDKIICLIGRKNKDSTLKKEDNVLNIERSITNNEIQNKEPLVKNNLEENQIAEKIDSIANTEQNTIPTLEEIEEEQEEDDDELEKTMFFRMVSVDQNELDSAYTQIIKEKSSKNSEKISDLIVDTTRENTSSEKHKSSKKDLELLQKKKKNFKSILDKTIYLKTEEIDGIVDILNQHDKLKINEKTIKKTFLDAYIDGKYYNYCGNVNVEYNGKNVNTKMSQVIINIADKLLQEKKKNDTKYEEKVTKYQKLFTLVLYLEQLYLEDIDLEEKRKNYKNKILKTLGNIYTESMLKNIIQDTIKIQKQYSDMIEDSFEKLDTKIFNLNLDTAISKTKKIYAVNLDHNISFSKVYSDYIVDKTYKEGIVAEDKMYVLMTLLLRQIAKDILNANHNKKYVLYLPTSLYEKEKKLYNVFKLFNDEYAKNSIIILVKYDELSKYSKLIKSLIKEGYHFAVDLENTNKIKAKDRGCIEMMDYLFISRKTKEKEMLLENISEEAKEKIIHTDIINKLGNIWGE